MDLSKILSISGMSGLFKVIAQGKSGLIVESLFDKKRMPIQTSSKVSVLDNVSIYLNSGDTIPVQDVLKKIYEKQGGGPAIDSKTPDNELIKYFCTVLPEYDKEKVHTSDIRKVIGWYNLLQKTDIFSINEESPEANGKKEDASIITDESVKKPEHNFTHENQGKHLKTSANIPKKPIGVRKTGVA